MKQLDAKRLLCMSISLATVMSVTGIALADETVESEEPIAVEEAEETEASETELSQEEEDIISPDTEETDIILDEVTETEDVSFDDEVVFVEEDTDESEALEVTEVLDIVEVEATLNGWVKDDDGYWHYYKDNVALSGWQKINKKWYFFNTTTCMVVGKQTISDETYIFSEDGVMLTGWQQFNGTWYYLKKSGAAVKGWKEINKKWYFFGSEGGMYRDALVSLEGEYYRFGVNGAMFNGGWWKSSSSDSWYYFGKNGKAVRGWNKIDGKWYYFYDSEYSSPFMYKNAGSIIDGKYYVFDENGHLRLGWYSNYPDYPEYGSWYYLTENGAVSGWKKIGKYWYYFREPTETSTYINPYMYRSCSSVINGSYYRFDDKGRMITGWYSYDPDSTDADWFYFNSDGKAAMGWKQIGGKWYYFRMPDSNGYMYPRMLSNTSTTIDGTFYHFDENGKMITGWYNSNPDKPENGSWYYFNSNGKAAVGWKKISGKWYYFNEPSEESTYLSPYMRKGLIQIDGKWYYFDQNGVMKTGWQNTDPEKPERGQWFYMNSKGVALTGWHKIGKYWYYFSETSAPYMYSGSTLEYDGYFYGFDENGRMITNSWHRQGTNGDWHYFGKDGKAYAGWHKIGKNWYYFYKSSYYAPSLWTNGIYAIDGQYYYFDSNGVMKTGWIKERGKWYYAGSNGQIVHGVWKKMNKKWYYFGTDGAMATGYVLIDNNLYHFNDKGVCLNPNDYKN